MPNGSDLTPGVPPPPSNGPVCLGLLGGLGTAKGADLLKAALQTRRYENLRFILVDHSLPEGASYTQSWGDNEVEFIGKTEFATVGDVYARLHAVLAISVCVESFGLVAREAARLRRWVIASDRGGVSRTFVMASMAS